MQFVLDDAGGGAGGNLGVHEEGLGVLLHQTVQRLFWRRRTWRTGAPSRPLGLPGDGSHALLTFSPWCPVEQVVPRLSVHRIQQPLSVHQVG